MIRTLAERAARNRWFRKRLPNGTFFYVTPDSQLKYLKRNFDTDLINLAEQYVDKNSIVWDVGANCGVFAFSASNAQAVYAIEADPFLAFLLQQSVVLNNTRTTVIPVAASDEIGMAEFAIAARGRASNYLVSAGGRSQTGGERGRILVPTITLDALMDRLGAPTIIKIDVEGAEIGVLQGANRILRDARPIIYLEVAEATRNACFSILEKEGYQLSKGAEMNWLAVPH